MKVDTAIFLRGEAKTIIAPAPVPSGLTTIGMVDAFCVELVGAGIDHLAPYTIVAVTKRGIPVGNKALR